MLRTLRRLRSLVAVLVLVTAAGPAGAVCGHALAEALGEVHDAAEGHGMMETLDVVEVHASHAPVVPPCHDAPAEQAPAPHDDVPPRDSPSHDNTHHCESACCASPASRSDDIALAPDAASDAVPAPVEGEVEVVVEVPEPAPGPQPPPAPLRVHLALQRFLI